MEDGCDDGLEASSSSRNDAGAFLSCVDHVVQYL